MPLETPPTATPTVASNTAAPNTAAPITVASLARPEPNTRRTRRGFGRVFGRRAARLVLFVPALLFTELVTACGAPEDPSGGGGGTGVGGGTGGDVATGGDAATGGAPAMGGDSSSGASTGSGGSGGSDDSARSAGCGDERTLQNGRVTIQSGSDERSYILRVPDDYDGNRPYRLVLAYHWLGGNANDVADGATTDGPYYGLWGLAEGSTIFVAPEGIDQGWGNPGGRDVDFTDAILQQVTDDLCIDTERVFATGFSFGGAMSYALACARPDVFRAVAVYSAALLSGCEGGTEPVAYFAIRGVQEPVIDPTTTGRALRDNFAQINGCTPQTPPEPSEGSGTHICTSYDGCTEGYPVRWCAFDDGHVSSPRDQGQQMSWVPHEAWSFIEQF